MEQIVNVNVEKIWEDYVNNFREIFLVESEAAALYLKRHHENEELQFKNRSIPVE